MFRTDPLAYFITFRTYGTWLPGDERGWTHRDRAAITAPLEAPAPPLVHTQTGLMRSRALLLTPAMRSAVEVVIRNACAHRSWTLHAVNVRTNHVHLVVGAPVAPEKVMGDLKARATRRLREERFLPENRPVWSRHGSTRWLWDDRAVQGACDYVVHGQD